MSEYAEAGVQPVVRDEDYKRFLRFPPTRALEGPLAENAAWVQSWYAAHGRPWWGGRRLQEVHAAGDTLELEGECFHCPTLAQRAARAKVAVVVAVSAGPEVDREAEARWAAEEPDRSYFLQAWGGAVVASLLEQARRTIARSHGAEDARVRLGHAPGYPDWSIAEMPRLLALLQRGRVNPLPGPLSVLDSGMLVPKKSQLVVFIVEQPAS